VSDKIGRVAPTNIAANEQDRRGQPRAEIRVPLELRLPDMDAALHGDALNISKGGMFIAMQRPLAVGTEIDVEVVLEDGGLVLHAVVEVVRRVAEGRKPGVGVRFVVIAFGLRGV
jgi:Tfp pilus assembly protein PilZ